MKPPRMVVESTDAIFQEQLRIHLQKLNRLAQRMMTDRSSFSVESRELPWPGMVVLRCLPGGAAGKLCEPLDQESVLMFIQGLERGIDMVSALKT